MSFEIRQGNKLPDSIDLAKYIHPQDKQKFGGFKTSGYRLPGIIDIHIHGAFGWDFSFGDFDRINILLDNLLAIGLTGIVPTIITCDEEKRLEALRVLKRVFETRVKPPLLHGIHLEGPFLSNEKRGAHRSDFLRKPSVAEFNLWQEASGGNIKIITIAPELPGAIEFIEEVSKSGVVCSIGHSNATSKQTDQAIKAGAKHVTHLFNAMPNLHHRNPNILSAVLANKNISVEIIADGRHISPDIVKFASNLYDNENIVLISDAIAPAGCDDGNYDFYGSNIEKKDGICYSQDGVIFGSGMTLVQSVYELNQKHNIQWGFIGTSIWRSPCILLGIDTPDTEVLVSEDMTWVATRDKTTWYWNSEKE